MARKHTESELMRFIELYLSGISHQTLVADYTLKLSYEELKHKYPVTHLCEILDISKSSYYKWLKREPSKAELKRINLMKWIKEIHEVFKGIYGYRRMTIFLNFFRNAKVNHKTVRRLMNIMGIKAVIRRKRKITRLIMSCIWPRIYWTVISSQKTRWRSY